MSLDETHRHAHTVKDKNEAERERMTPCTCFFPRWMTYKGALIMPHWLSLEVYVGGGVDGGVDGL